MLHVWSCVTQQHDLRLVVLAFILCLFACSTTMSLLARTRAAAPQAQGAWLLGAGVVAGSGIWATHFVAMLAFRAGFPVAYDPTLTTLSIVIAISLCAAGFAMALGRTGPVAGGALAGAAIAVMHYAGMAAVRAPADAIWDWRYVAASAAIGMSAMALGLWIVVRFANQRAYAAGALIFTAAICSMHFTGMSAVTYRFDPAINIPNLVLEPTTLAIAVAAVALLIVALGLTGALLDSHLSGRDQQEARRLRAHITQLEATQKKLEQRGEDFRLAMEAAATASEAKSAFLAAMSHELRTPLNAIIGFSDVISSSLFGPLGDQRYADYVRDIHNSGIHLLALINDILDIARIDAGKGALREEVVGLEGMIDDTLRMMAQQAGAAGIRLTRDIAPDARMVRGDERRLRQVLINLLGNAIKFTGMGGTVAVRVLRNPSELMIAVSDTGIGMSEKDIPVALERFGQIDSTLARKYTGTGLGLPLSKGLVELHGGTLTIQSQVNAGTTVTVTLPAERIVDPASLAA